MIPVPTKLSAQAILAIAAAALGYFVDIYDLWIFNVLRVTSIKGLGFSSDEQVKHFGELLINCQMGGFLIGGFLFGVLSDKKGRLATLFGSILLYSAANIANGFVTTIDAYVVCRVLAGVGLAGELGAGIALVSELVPKAQRGWATTVVASIGVAGAVAAGLFGQFHGQEWRLGYFIGGGMGVALLLLRLGVLESGMFNELIERQDVRRGDFRTLFGSADRIKRYLAAIFIGLPVWYFSALYQTFSPELQKGLHTIDPAKAPEIILFSSIGLTLGDVFFGGLSQLLKSRRTAIFIAYITMIASIIGIYTLGTDRTLFIYFMIAGGFGAGFWAVFATTAGEAFGTNIRGTVAITAPCIVRGMVIPMTILRGVLSGPLGIIGATQAIGVAVLLLAGAALVAMPETYGRDLDFIESDSTNG